LGEISTLNRGRRKLKRRSTTPRKSILGKSAPVKEGGAHRVPKQWERAEEVIKRLVVNIRPAPSLVFMLVPRYLEVQLEKLVSIYRNLLQNLTGQSK